VAAADVGELECGGVGPCWIGPALHVYGYEAAVGHAALDLGACHAVHLGEVGHGADAQAPSGVGDQRS
jgi:hypothetical protein